jgi:thioredoxin-like negative regulator of GroEL
MKRLSSGWVAVATGIFAACCWGVTGGAAVSGFTGTYKEALREAAAAGKPVMLDFYTDWCPHCKEMDKVVAQIPEMMGKFVYYRVNAERNTSLAKQFDVKAYPTVVFVKPDGTEFHRWAGAYQTAGQMTDVLQVVLDKAGHIERLGATAASPGGAPAGSAVRNSAQKTAAASEFRMVQTYVSMGRNDSAIQACQHILEKYPDTQTALQARQKLSELGGAAP